MVPACVIRWCNRDVIRRYARACALVFFMEKEGSVEDGGGGGATGDHM
jgi:hypothetical protein